MYVCMYVYIYSGIYKKLTSVMENLCNNQLNMYSWRKTAAVSPPQKKKWWNLTTCSGCCSWLSLMGYGHPSTTGHSLWISLIPNGLMLIPGNPATAVDTRTDVSLFAMRPSSDFCGRWLFIQIEQMYCLIMEWPFRMFILYLWNYKWAMIIKKW